MANQEGMLLVVARWNLFRGGMGGGGGRVRMKVYARYIFLWGWHVFIVAGESCCACEQSTDVESCCC